MAAIPSKGSDEIVAAAQTLLKTLGLTVSDLVEAAGPDGSSSRGPVPTFTEYVPVVEAATPKSSAVTWIIYWRVLVAEWGDRRVDEPTSSEIMQLANKVQQNSVQRRNSRGGQGAKSNFIDAVKCLYRNAVADRYLSAAYNPATSLRKPSRRANPRRALTREQVAEINQVAAITGPDPALDTLILRFLSETACRRGGVLRVRLCDLDRGQCTVRLHEKGDTIRDQPISPTLVAALLDHAAQRNPNSRPEDPLFRYLNGTPIRWQTFDQLWKRLGRHRAWIKTRGVSSHWLRYTTLTWVERNFSYAVAAAFAGHVQARGSTGNTLTYVTADIEEVATAVAVLTGEPHPLAMNVELTPEVDR
jgi:integrase